MKVSIKNLTFIIIKNSKIYYDIDNYETTKTKEQIYNIISYKKPLKNIKKPLEKFIY